MVQISLSYSYKKMDFPLYKSLICMYVASGCVVWGKTMLVNLPRAPGSIDSKECHRKTSFFPI